RHYGPHGPGCVLPALGGSRALANLCRRAERGCVPALHRGYPLASASRARGAALRPSGRYTTHVSRGQTRHDEERATTGDTGHPPTCPTTPAGASRTVE